MKDQHPATSQHFRHFLWEAMANYRDTGALAPSSRFLAQLIAKESLLEGAHTVLEVGPGTGVFTEELLRQMTPGGKLVVIEKNGRFAQVLRQRFPSLTVIEDCATLLPTHMRALQLEPADRIISGLPWAAMPPRLQVRLLRAIRDCLKPGGIFTTFAYFGPHWLPAGQLFRRRLQRVFSKVERTAVEVRNLPPAFVYRATLAA
jgi:phosphatidylethanolamine/phosphatidyl-N-methylethanolamine N-methyltransferase